MDISRENGEKIMVCVKPYKRKGRQVKGYNKTINFKTTAGYKKWLAYGHIHGVFKKPGHVRVKIHGKVHKVKH